MVDDTQPTLDTKPGAAKPTAAEVKLAYEYFGILPGTKLEDMLGPICTSPIPVRNLVRKGLHMLEETMEHSSLGRQRLKSDTEAENKEAQSLAAALLATHAATLPKTVPSPLSSTSPPLPLAEPGLGMWDDAKNWDKMAALREEIVDACASARTRFPMATNLLYGPFRAPAVHEALAPQPPSVLVEIRAALKGQEVMCASLQAAATTPRQLQLLASMDSELYSSLRTRGCACGNAAVHTVVDRLEVMLRAVPSGHALFYVPVENFEPLVATGSSPRSCTSATTAASCS